MKKKLKISLLLNIIIFVLVVVASVIMFTGFQFMHGVEPIFEERRLLMLKFFTVQSNIFAGLIALVSAYKQIRILRGKERVISKRLSVLQLMATTAVTITFLVVFLYLGPISDGGIPVMLMNSNLFYHFIIPVLCIINFIFFEKSNKLKFKYTFMGVIPTLLYGTYYVGNILIHMENGKVSPVYDWYWFVQNGVWTAVIVMPMMLLGSYMISLVLWGLNRKGK